MRFRSPFARKRPRPWHVGALLLLLVASAEIYLRVAYSEQLKVGAYPLIYEPDPYLGYRYRPSTVSRISVPSIDKEVRIGPQGFYGPEVAVEKPPGTVRIAIVGSSNATGIWMDGERPFSLILQGLYVEAGRSVEVLNLAIDGGYHDLANVRIAETHALEFSPDLVLLSVETRIMNDVLYREAYRGYVYEPGHSNQTEEEIQRARLVARDLIDRVEACPLKPLYDLSYIFRALHRRAWTPTEFRLQDVEEHGIGRLLEAYRRKRVEIYYVRTPMSEHHTLTRVREAADRVERTGARLVVFQYGSDAGIVEAFRRYGLTCWSLDIPKDDSLLHEHDGHYNQKAHELIARRLFATLEDGNDVLAGSGAAAPPVPDPVARSAAGE